MSPYNYKAQKGPLASKLEHIELYMDKPTFYNSEGLFVVFGSSAMHLILSTWVSSLAQCTVMFER